MDLKLYNTRTRVKEEFRPLDEVAGKPQSEWNIRMYVCGPTVYDFAHIGNARPIIVFDVLYRLLRHLYGPEHVTYARNITDVDDKINARAVEMYPGMAPEEAIRKLTTETTAQFHKDVAALGCLPPTAEPRATDYIAQMKEMITALYEADIAYVADDHVLFSVADYGKAEGVPAYGSLAKRSLDEMIAGARVDVAPYKRDAMDFVLWKPSAPGQPAWPSPLNIRAPGRPGWHLECSAMSKAILGDEFDIHGGGIDLVFPHHENEVAQSCGANRTAKMANFWMHNGFLQVEGKKMSKSEGNFVTILQHFDGWSGHRWPGEVMRLAMLKTHYSEPINWTVERLEESWNEIERWAKGLRHGLGDEGFKSFRQKDPNNIDGVVLDALLDDLNTPKAISEIHALNKRAESGDRDAAWTLAESLKWLGIYRPAYHAAYTNVSGYSDTNRIMLAKYRSALQDARAIILNEYNNNDNRDAVESKINSLTPSMAIDGVRIGVTKNSYVYLEGGGDNVSALIKERLNARKARNWAEADRIRDELAAKGILLKDAKNPETGEIETTWEIAR